MIASNLTRAALLVLGLSVGAQALADHHDNPGFNRAISVWWLLFNNPSACQENPGGAERCGPIDVFGRAYVESLENGTPDPALISPNLAAEIGVVFATGGVTTSRGGIRLVGAIYRSPVGGGLDIDNGNLVDPMGLGRGYENPNAEVHLVVRDHGKAHPNRNELRLQILNFLEPYCSDPNLDYFAGPNTCRDAQFAQFAPDETGVDGIFEFHDPSHAVHGARAFLERNGDMLQFVIETRVTPAP
ncbi:MAG: hypothetical protein AAFX85_11190 [Pseudomonadota bacterium]